MKSIAFFLVAFLLFFITIRHGVSITDAALLIIGQAFLQVAVFRRQLIYAIYIRRKQAAERRCLVTAEQINRKLAVWMGWTDIKVGKLYTWELYGKSPDPIIGRTRVPDYHASLDVVHECEMKLTEVQAMEFRWKLQQGFLPGTQAAQALLGHATAPQRCEALLKTLNLWEEAP